MTEDISSRMENASIIGGIDPILELKTGPRNLLEVKRVIHGLTMRPSKLSNLISAINAVGKADLHPVKRPSKEDVDQALSRISVDALSLTPRLDRRVGARLGYTPEGWSNIGWRVRTALRQSGAWPLFGPTVGLQRREYSPIWQIAVQTSVSQSFYFGLLAHWATMNNIAPSELRQVHVPAFHAWLRSWKTKHYARRSFRDAMNDWNKSARTVPGWPGIELAPVRRRENHYSVAKEDWPPELIASVHDIIEKFVAPDIDDDDTADAICTKSAKTYEERLFRILSAYVRAKRIDPKSVTNVDVLMTPQDAKLAFAFMRDWIRRRKPEADKSSEVHGAAKLVATVAARCFRGIISAETILTLHEMARNRSPKRSGMTPKNRSLLRRFDDESHESRFLHLPFEVYRRMPSGSIKRRVEAVKLMLAFAVGQSIEAPIRPANQEGLILGRHIYKVKLGSITVLRIQVPAGEVKNDVDLDFEIEGPLVKLFDDYVTNVRPLLCDEGNPYLYPGVDLAPKFRGSLSPQIARFIEDELGEPHTGQQFRHSVGYLYLRSHPGDYETVRQFLGHKDITTTMHFYASMAKRDASKKLSRFINQRRKELPPNGKSPRRRPR